MAADRGCVKPSLYQGLSLVMIGESEKALKYFKLASDKNYHKATFFYGLLLFENEEVVDKKEALRFIKLAADNGEPAAAYKYGSILLNEPFTNIPEALQYLKNSALMGYNRAARELASLLLEGKVIEQNIEEAKKFLTIDAEAGDTYAKDKLKELSFQTPTEIYVSIANGGIATPNIVHNPESGYNQANLLLKRNAAQNALSHYKIAVDNNYEIELSKGNPISAYYYLKELEKTGKLNNTERKIRCCEVMLDNIDKTSNLNIIKYGKIKEYLVLKITKKYLELLKIEGKDIEPRFEQFVEVVINDYTSKNHELDAKKSARCKDTIKLYCDFLLRKETTKENLEKSLKYNKILADMGDTQAQLNYEAISIQLMILSKGRKSISEEFIRLALNEFKETEKSKTRTNSLH